ALPADAQTRVGPRPRLPLKQPPCQSTVTLARLLQQAQTTQLTRRPAPDQPCPQPPEAGHLAACGRTARACLSRPSVGRQHRGGDPPPPRPVLARVRECAGERTHACVRTPSPSS